MFHMWMSAYVFVLDLFVVTQRFFNGIFCSNFLYTHPGSNQSHFISTPRVSGLVGVFQWDEDSEWLPKTRRWGFKSEKLFLAQINLATLLPGFWPSLPPENTHSQRGGNGMPLSVCTQARCLPVKLYNNAMNCKIRS